MILNCRQKKAYAEWKMADAIIFWKIARQKKNRKKSMEIGGNIMPLIDALIERLKAQDFKSCKDCNLHNTCEENGLWCLNAIRAGLDGKDSFQIKS